MELMGSRDLKGLALAMTVSDPWEFVTEHGSGPFGATVVATDRDAEAHEGNALLVRLDAPIGYAGATREYFVAVEHSSSDHLSDLLRNRAVNCNRTWISQERTQSANPLDLSWWRGGLALLASLRTLQHR